MRDLNKGDGLLYSHVPTVDIARPHITDALFTFEIILSDTLHGDRCVFKMLYLPLDRVPVLVASRH